MNKLFLVAAGAVVLSGGLFADTVTGTGTLTTFPAGFAGSTPAFISGTQFTSGTPTPFWNNPSDDMFGTGSTTVMHDANIGYLLTDTGGFATSSVTPVLGSDTVANDYVSGVGGATDPGFSFVRTATAENIAILFASGGENNGAGNGGTVQIGYYVGGVNTLIYNSVSNTTTATGLTAFNPGANYGLYAVVCYAVNSCETYYSGQANTGPVFGNTIPNANPPVTGDAWNHFALFQTAAGNWVIGFTEQNGYYGENYGDFQDVVLEITATPEPGTVAIMGLGLAGLGILGRRRFAKK